MTSFKLTRQVSEPQLGPDGRWYNRERYVDQFGNQHGVDRLVVAPTRSQYASTISDGEYALKVYIEEIGGIFSQGRPTPAAFLQAVAMIGMKISEMVTKRINGEFPLPEEYRLPYDSWNGTDRPWEREPDIEIQFPAQPEFQFEVLGNVPKLTLYQPAGNHSYAFEVTDDGIVTATRDDGASFEFLASEYPATKFQFAGFTGANLTLARQVGTLLVSKPMTLDSDLLPPDEFSYQLGDTWDESDEVVSQSELAQRALDFGAGSAIAQSGLDVRSGSSISEPVEALDDGEVSSSDAGLGELDFDLVLGFGGQVASLLIGDNIGLKLVSQALIGSLGALARGGNSGASLTGDVNLDNIGLSVAGTITSFATSQLVSALFDSLDVEGPIGSLAESVVSRVAVHQLNALIARDVFGATQGFGLKTTYFIDEIQQAHVIATDLPTLGQSFSAVGFDMIGSFVGHQLAMAMFGGNAQGAAIGSMIGSLVGSALIPIPGLGAFVGSFIGSIIGGLFGNESSGPYSVARIRYVDDSQGFAVYAEGADNGGDLELARNMANTAADVLNGILDVVGGRHANGFASAQTEIGFGWYQGHFFSERDGTNESQSNGFNSPAGAVFNGVMRNLDTMRIEGGNIYMKRAIDRTNVTTLEGLTSDLSKAGDYSAYKDNAVLYERALAGSGDRALYDRLEQTLLRAKQLNLDLATASEGYMRATSVTPILIAGGGGAAVNPAVLELGPTLNPLVIDLNGDGITVVGRERSRVSFDMDGDGYLEHTSWIGPDDGFLVIDRNQNGLIDGPQEMISDRLAGSEDVAGFASLRKLDTNLDGMFDWQDAAYNDARVWVDGNQNGSVDVGELQALYQFNIRGIDLGGFRLNQAGSGARVMTNSSFIRWDGTAGLIGNVRMDFEESGTRTRDLDGHAGWGRIDFETNGKSIAVAVTTSRAELDAGAAGVMFVNGGVAGDHLFTTGAGDVVLNGGLGNDTLTGGLGHDELNGGEGQDTLSGGAGDDVLVIGASDNDVVDGGAGLDMIQVEGDANFTFNMGAHNVEVATLGAGNDSITTSTATAIAVAAGAGNDTLTGNSGDDRLDGQEGNDSLTGGAGDDLLVGGAGQDTLAGGDGNDLLQIDVEDLTGATQSRVSGGAGFDMVLVEGDQGIAFDLHLSGVEMIVGGVGADTFTTTGTDNVTLVGGRGDDTLTGGAGDDRLEGGEGNDRLVASAGADLVEGGAGVDTADYSGSAAAVTIALDGTAGVGGTAAGDRLTGVELLVGSAHADTLRGGIGDDTLRGGAGADVLDGGAGSDTASYEANTVAVVVNLGTGSVSGGDATGDTLTSIENVTGSAHADTLTGSGGANILRGLAGNDTLSGGDGDDTLEGGVGSDVLSGGNGVDTVSHESSSAGVSVTLGGAASGGDAAGDTLTDIENLTGSTHADTLTGNSGANVLRGLAGDDMLTGAGGADTLVGGAGTDTASYTNSAAGVTIDLGTGTASGGDAQGDVLEEIENLAGSGQADTLTGDENNNVLRGQGGADTLAGADGNDTLEGGAGGDTLDGGQYLDTADYSQSSAGVTVGLDGTAASGGDAAGDTFKRIENLSGSAHNDTLTGSLAANVLRGGGGNDTLRGSGGTDTLEGGAGSDTLDGGTGTDFADYSLSGSAVTVNLATNTHGGDASGDTLIAIENVIGSASGDTLTGDSGNNALIGLDGSDVIKGAAGDDFLSGGEGNDTLDGGAGADAIDGGEGTDLADYSSATQGVTVDLSGLADGAGDARGDIFAAVEGVIGSAQADTISGDGGVNILRGEGGNDILAGGAGADTLDGGLGTDTADYSRSGGPINIDLGTPNANHGGDAEGDALVSIETIVGTSGSDRIAGDSNVNNFQGGGGNDTLLGAAGDDTLKGELGADVLVGGVGADTLDGGIGADTASYVGSGSGVSVNLAGTVSGGDATGDILISIENLIGSELVDQLTGDANDNVLSGRGGADTLTGNAGADILDGGAGNDLLRGGAGNDRYIVARGTGIDTVEDSSSTQTEYLARTATYQEVHGYYIGGGEDPLQFIAPTIHRSDYVRNEEITGVVGGEGEIGVVGYRLFLNGTQLLPAGQDTVQVGTGIAAAELAFSLVGADLIIGIRAVGDTSTTAVNCQDRIVLKNWTTNDTKVEKLQLADGQVFDLAATMFTGGLPTIGSRIVGGVEADSLAGTVGADTFVGGAGADIIDGGDGIDTADYRTSTFGVSIDLATKTGAGGDADGDALLLIENVVGSSAADTLSGDANVNVLDGGAGNDTLSGGIGNDTLLGGAGSDFITGGAGADSLVGGDGADTASYLGSSSAVSVDLEAAGAESGGDAQGDMLTGIEDVEGSAFDDTIKGDAGVNVLSGRRGNDSLFGGGGADTLLGGLGNDVLEGGVGGDRLDGGDGSDTASYAGSASGLVADLDTVRSGGDAQGDILISIENLIGSAYIDQLLGDANSNMLDGRAGNDTLEGNGGADVLDGGAGNDLLKGGVGNDRYVLGRGAGIDTVSESIEQQYEYLARTATYAEVHGMPGGGEGNPDQPPTVFLSNYTRNEEIWETGGEMPIHVGYRLFLTGTSLIDGGYDVVQIAAGLTPADVAVATVGNDLIIGIRPVNDLSMGATSCPDRIVLSNWVTAQARVEAIQFADGSLFDLAATTFRSSTSGADTITGITGNEVLAGGAGNDTLKGSAGNDVYTLVRGGGADLIDDEYRHLVSTTTQVPYSYQEQYLNEVGFATPAQVYGSGGGEDYVPPTVVLANYADNIPVYGVGGEGSQVLLGFRLFQWAWRTVTGYNTVTTTTEHHDDGGVDSIYLSAGIGLGDLAFQRVNNNNDLIIALRDPQNPGTPITSLVDRITIKDYSDPLDRIEWLVFADGTRITIETVVAWVDSGQIMFGNGPAADTLTGDSGANILLGLGGNDTLSGGGGADTLSGGAGADVLNGGDGTDTADYGGAVTGVTVDLLEKAGSRGEADGDTLTAVENVLGSAHGDVLIGDAGANVLNGLAGNDGLIGGGGNDTLLGGNGNDVLTGGTGADTLDGGAGTDAASYLGSAASVTVNLGGLSASGGDAVGDVLVSIENLEGSAYDDTLTGSAGANVLSGRRGEDVLVGGGGGDTLIGGVGADTASYAGSSAGVTVDLNGMVSGGDATGDVLISIENLTGSDLIDQLSGDQGDNVLRGGGGNDTLDGEAGADTYVLERGTGVDTVHDRVDSQFEYLARTASNEEVNGYSDGDGLSIPGTVNLSDYVRHEVIYGTGGEGEQFIVGYKLYLTGTQQHEAGTDTVQIAAGLAPADIVMAFSGADLIVGIRPIGNPNASAADCSDKLILKNWTTAVTRVELLKFADGQVFSLPDSAVLLNGTASANSLTGTGANNWIDGAAGNDTLSGADGDDVLIGAGGTDTLAGGNGNDIAYGGDDNDVVSGDAGNDALFGQAGVDNLNGGDGNDTLDGGAGNDTLTGGVGDDTYMVDATSDQVVEDAGAGIDTVGSTVSLTLGSHLEILRLAGTDAINATGNALDNILVGNAAGNTLDGGLGSDSMSGGQGNDVYLVDDTGDIVSEDVGAGVDTVRADLASATLAANVENLVFTGSGSFTGVGNELANAITGGAADDILFGLDGADTLSGGDGNDIVVGGLGADSLVGGLGTDLADYSASQAAVTVDLGAGTGVGGDAEGDQLSGIEGIRGSALGDVLAGSTADNTLIGNGGDDTLVGAAGHDTLDGGTGADRMTGGTGNDIYFVDNGGDTVIEAVGEGADEVRTNVSSYSLAAEVEKLTYLGDASFVGTGNATANTIVGGAGNDTLQGGGGNDSIDGGDGADTARFSGNLSSYSINTVNGVTTVTHGGGGADGVDTLINVEFLRFADQTADLHANTITGSSGNDTLIGTAGVDAIHGLGGNDTLDGGTGADTLIGGQGDDTYVVDSVSDVVAEAASEGADEVRTGLANYTLDANIEKLTFTGTGSFNGTGNAAANTITGGTGADTLEGAVGNDTLDGGSGSDTARFSGNSSAYTINTVGSVTTVTHSGSNGIDTLTNVEFLKFDDQTIPIGGGSVIDGTSGNDVLSGGAGNDIINGFAGHDTINGAGGNDTIVGGTGDDTLDGGDGDDIFLVTGNQDRDRVIGGNGADTILGSSGNDTIGLWSLSVADSVDRIDGGAGTNNIVGNGSDNVLNFSATVLVNIGTIDGGSGHDTITGTSGNDTIIGGAGDDTLNGGDGDDVFLVTGNQDRDRVIGGNGADTILGSSGNDTIGLWSLSGADSVESIDGGAGTNNIVGNGSNNVLNFSATVLVNIGTIDGGSGHDTITGTSGNDTIVGGAGSDVLNGGSGVDTADYGSSSAGVTVNLFSSTFSGGDAAGDTLSSIENVTGSSYNDVLNGTSGNNVLVGGAGNDTISGGWGDDTVSGGDGDDVLQLAGLGSDVASGGQGNDAIIGGSGDDTFGLYSFDASNSVETIDGGAGVNIIAAAAGPTTLDFSATTVLNISKIVGSAGDNIMIGSGGNDTLEGALGNDTLSGRGGDDVFLISGSSGTDRIDGGAGADTILGGSGDDTIGLQGLRGIDSIERIDGGTGTNVIAGSGSSDVLDFSSTVLANISRIDGGSGADTIIGSGVSDTISGGFGNDTLDGGGGSDTAKFSGNYSAYTVVTTNGVTTVTHNSGGTDGIDTLTNVENMLFADQTVSVTGGGVPMTYTGTTGADTLTGSNGADIVTGGSGNDTLDGGAGVDVLDGGTGYDVYKIARTSAQETIDNSETDAATADDRIAFASDIAYDQLWFARTGNDLIVNVIGTSTRATVLNWYGDANAKLDSFTAGDRVLTENRVQQLVDAMAAFNPPGPSDTNIPTSVRQQLDTQLAAAWQQ